MINDLKLRVRPKHENVFLKNLEERGWEAVREGYYSKEFEDEGVMLPVIEAGSTYKIPIKYDELITVETHISEMTPVRVRCDYRIFNQEGTEAARGFTCHAFVNRQGRPVNAAKKIPQLFHQLEDVLRG